METHTPNKRKLGLQGENVARSYLEAKGYHFFAANFLTRYGELDLVMKDRATVVFVEVKSRRNEHYGDPAEAITPGKINHLTRAAMIFIKQHRLYEVNLRFDVVLIEETGVKHIVDAFPAGGGFYF